MALLVALFASSAALNWWSRWADHRPAEWISKPLATVSAVALGVSVDATHPTQRAWFVAGLIACLVGDVLLMLPKEQFVAGLGSFLAGHLAFIAGFVSADRTSSIAAVALATAAVASLIPVIVRVRAAVRTSAPTLIAPVTAYMAVIIAMVLAAALRGSGWGLAGAISFALSDAILAHNRFVNARRAYGVAVMVTYHAALAGLVADLVA